MFSIDDITPHKLAVALLIRAYCLGRTKAVCEGRNGADWHRMARFLLKQIQQTVF